MGLESIELILDVEDVFGINLPDTEVERVRTVGQLCNLIRQHVGTNHNSAFISSESVCCLNEDCGYCLNTLPAQGMCPECGQSYNINVSVEEIVTELLVENFDIKREAISMESRFIEDLNF
ncbi:hypothetical protein [Poriferisphaera sp. WC338]|uniref:hypothetical protein n=1 Tax=Poriferisphaera sp. WC338 TaxID=3425129 RepID=UPI003D812CE5